MPICDTNFICLRCSLISRATDSSLGQIAAGVITAGDLYLILSRWLELIPSNILVMLIGRTLFGWFWRTSRADVCYKIQGDVTGKKLCFFFASDFNNDWFYCSIIFDLNVLTNFYDIGNKCFYINLRLSLVSFKSYYK